MHTVKEINLEISQEQTDYRGRYASDQDFRGSSSERGDL